MFGWAIYESIQRYPQVLSSREIQRRLKIAKNSALLLKRRLQLFATDQTPRIKELMQNELKEKFNGVMLPRVSENKNVNEVLQGKAVPQVDSVVLFSASQRANQGRKRHKHTGQTASIYMNDKLGGKQIGTLVHTLSWKGGPVIYDSISNNKGETLRPLLDEYIPKDVPVFTDEGYKWYFRINKSHRMVNHNRKSEDKRYKWARNRWCKDGVHNQVAEGNHRKLKWQFTAGYSYITPEYSQLYLNEYSFWKNVKYYGWEKLIRSDEENRELLKQRKAIVNQVSEKENKNWSEQVKCDTIGKKSPVESQREARGVRDRTTGYERNAGQNNGVIAGNKKALDGARRDGGEGAGEKEGFRKNLGAESRQGRRPCAMPERGMVGILRRNLCEILDSNQ